MEAGWVMLMAWLYRQAEVSPESLTAEEVQRFIRTHAGVLDGAVDAALREEPLDGISVQRLKESDYVFSGIKVFHELNEAFPSLLDGEGNPKPFERFLNDVQKVHEAYNVNYLRTEYNFARASALMAARWKRFERDGDRYLLQYRTISDDRVRRTHRMLHGITLPISSPFWDKYFPPNGWNCRCTVVQVRKGKYPVSNEREAMNLGSQATAGKYQEMFMFNPGKRMACFPAYNAYTFRRCNLCQWRPDKMKLAADIPDNELCKACRIVQEMAYMKNSPKALRKQLTQWYKENLPTVKIGKMEMKRFEVATPEENVLTVVNRNFYEETAAKYKDSPDYPERLKLARQAHLLFPKAKYVRDEEPRDHKDASKFKVYEYETDGWTIEFKCKVNNDGYFLHYMRLLKQ